MQETKNSSCYSTVAGALFAFGGVMELFQWLRILRFMSFSDHVQVLIWVASCAVLAFGKAQRHFSDCGFCPTQPCLSVQTEFHKSSVAAR